MTIPVARLYRTGDRAARWRADGLIEFLGRVDDQIKIRGFRVELGEVEAALAGHPSVREAVVVVREDARGVKQLVAYFVACDGQPPCALELRRWVGKVLPDYMVPSASVAAGGTAIDA